MTIEPRRPADVVVPAAAEHLETHARDGAKPDAHREASEAGGPRRRRRTRWFVRGALVLAALGLVAAAVWNAVPLLTPPPVSGLLTASGRIEGRVTTLTPKASAIIVRLHVDEGDAVKPGQVLATLDDEAQRQRVRAAEEQVNALAARVRAANIQLATTDRQVALQVEQAAAALREAEARVERARANELQARRDEERYARLSAQGFVARQEGEHARLKAVVEAHGVREAEQALDRAQKQLALARLGAQQLDSLRSERDALERQSMQARAQVAEQRSHVADFTIASPSGGRVLTRTVELGERVDPGTPLFTLVDLDRLYVKIYVPEPEVGKVALGQEARVHVDAYPDRAFAARVSKVAQEAEFTPKNVETREERVKLVFAVEVALAENPGGVLKPGMPADAVIRWRRDAPWAAPAR